MHDMQQFRRNLPRSQAKATVELDDALQFFSAFGIIKVVNVKA